MSILGNYILTIVICLPNTWQSTVSISQTCKQPKNITLWGKYHCCHCGNYNIVIILKKYTLAFCVPSGKWLSQWLLKLFSSWNETCQRVEVLWYVYNLSDMCQCGILVCVFLLYRIEHNTIIVLYFGILLCVQLMVHITLFLSIIEQKDAFIDCVFLLHSSIIICNILYTKDAINKNNDLYAF